MDETDNKAPTGLGFEGWLNRLSRQALGDAGEETVDPTKPLDDFDKLSWLISIDRRYLSTLPRVTPGLVTEKVVQDLESIGADYERLLAAGPPKLSLYTTDAVRGKVADVQNTVAQGYGLLRNYALASQRYVSAAEIYAAIGRTAEAQRSREQLTHIKFDQVGNVDDEIQRLRALLATLPAGTVSHASTLIELAGIYSSSGDDYEAKELLQEAERTLDSLGGDPSGQALADALALSLSSIAQGQHKGGPTTIEEAIQVNNLYQQLYTALARIHETIDPQVAARYHAKATQRDSRANNDEFSKRMLQLLDDLEKG